jgi:hypothetical protein
MVIGLLASTITETISNASFWCSACVVIAVVLHFLGHDLTPFAIGSELGKDVGVLRRRITRCWLAVLILRSCLVDRAACPTASGSDIQRDLISKLHRLEIRGFVEYLATVICLVFVCYMRSLACPDLANRSWVSAFRTTPGSDWSFDMLTGSNSASWSMSTSVSSHFTYSSLQVAKLG